MTWLLALVLAGTVAPPGLRGVVNAEKSQRLPPAAKEALVRDGFTVVAGHERHFFSLYDRNAYEKVPSFISTDVVLHVFHVRFDDEVASLEQQFAVPALKDYASRQLARAQALNPPQRWLVQYHATALALLDPSANVDPSVAADVKKLLKGKGRGALSACPDPVDFSLFVPRGHYEHFGLQGYFRAVTFYGQCGFALKGASLDRAELLARMMDEASAKGLYRVRALQSFVSGPSDDPGLEVFEGLPPWPDPVPASAREAVAGRLASLRGPAVASLEPGPRFRLLGGSTTPDGALLGRSDRAVPSVLEVLAMLGSGEARKLLTPAPGEQSVPAGGGLYGKWLQLLGALMARPERQPPFAATEAWSKRLLVAAAGSYAELRHDTLLFVKQPLTMAEGGHPAELPATKVGGYVEPRPEIYRALLELTSALDSLRGDGQKQSADLAAFLRFLVDVSELELANQPFPKKMDERLRTIGTELEHLSRVHGDDSPPQALVADLFTVVSPDGGSRVLHVATGNVDELWVVAPRAGKLVLMRGGAFSFYEFLGEPGERLDDGRWMERLFEKPLARPGWAQPVTAPQKKSKELLSPD